LKEREMRAYVLHRECLTDAAIERGFRANDLLTATRPHLDAAKAGPSLFLIA
jgi:hypothetical protein